MKNRIFSFDSMLQRFMEESNRIEGIQEVRPGELEALKKFLDVDHMKVADLTKLVGVFEPTAQLRVQSGMNVQVGGYCPPPGGQAILYKLDNLLAVEVDKTPWKLHVEYEELHPFTDGNGRSGRALWLWKMLIEGKTAWVDNYLFLQSFYYQTLMNEQE